MAQAARAETRDSDDSLMARVAARDSGALRLLAERHAEIPWRIAYRMLGDPSEAEDVAQESMLKLWNQGDKWQAGKSGVAAWLTRVATNLCLDALRRRRFASGEEPSEVADPAMLADAGIQAGETRRAVVECIQTLPERQRAAIVLTYYEEEPNQNAAEAMSMKLKAFESMLFRARVSLRGCVESKGVTGAQP